MTTLDRSSPADLAALQTQLLGRFERLPSAACACICCSEGVVRVLAEVVGLGDAQLRPRPLFRLGLPSRLIFTCSRIGVRRRAMAMAHRPPAAAAARRRRPRRGARSRAARSTATRRNGKLARRSPRVATVLQLPDLLHAATARRRSRWSAGRCSGRTNRCGTSISTATSTDAAGEIALRDHRRCVAAADPARCRVAASTSGCGRSAGSLGSSQAWPQRTYLDGRRPEGRPDPRPARRADVLRVGARDGSVDPKRLASRMRDRQRPQDDGVDEPVRRPATSATTSRRCRSTPTVEARPAATTTSARSRVEPVDRPRIVDLALVSRSIRREPTPKLHDFAGGRRPGVPAEDEAGADAHRERAGRRSATEVDPATTPGAGSCSGSTTARSRSRWTHEAPVQLQLRADRHGRRADVGADAGRRSG